MLSLWLLLKAVHLLAFALWTALGLGAYLVAGKVCNDNILKRYELVAVIQALALAALGVTGFLMALRLGFPGWSKAAGMLFLILVLLELVHLSAARGCDTLRRRVNALTPLWATLLAAVLYLKLYKPTLPI